MSLEGFYRNNILYPLAVMRERVVIPVVTGEVFKGMMEAIEDMPLFAMPRIDHVMQDFGEAASSFTGGSPAPSDVNKSTISEGPKS